MTYFAANNSYGSETDVGFANTWFVLAFETKAARDAYVEQSPSIAARAIKRSEVTDYAASFDAYADKPRRPQPFSGQYWGIDPWLLAQEIHGCKGQVSVCTHHDRCERLNK